MCRHQGVVGVLANKYRGISECDVIRVVEGVLGNPGMSPSASIRHETCQNCKKFERGGEAITPTGALCGGQGAVDSLNRMESIILNHFRVFTFFCKLQTF